MVVLVTGANGQLGQSLHFIAKNYLEITFVYCDSKTLDITNLVNVSNVFEQFKPNFCINAAAYTAVDKAESEPEKAFAINVTGAKNLAEVCKSHNTALLHVSTDFVFDGNANTPYLETDIPSPTGVYGQTKLDGERVIQAIWNKHYIVRTSWVYSQFANNFMKTMLRCGRERDTLSVVEDQIGTPTNAIDLANALVRMIQKTDSYSAENFGIYNFSNQGQCSWYDFAKAIFENNDVKIDLKPISTSGYPTLAKRPMYSVLDKSKIKKIFGIEIKEWQESLKTIEIE
ncbi:MAG: dTDP-4-dehydrorhamnose reductase [Bacteroidota bacterium]